MKSYKLIEIDVPSVIDAWVSLKEAVRLKVTQIAADFIQQVTSAQEKCGQEVWSIKLHTDMTNPKMYLRVDREGKVLVATKETSTVVLDHNQLTHPNKHWDISLAKAKGIAQWVASISTEDIEKALATALEGSGN